MQIRGITVNTVNIAHNLTYCFDNINNRWIYVKGQSHWQGVELLVYKNPLEDLIYNKMLIAPARWGQVIYLNNKVYFMCEIKKDEDFSNWRNVDISIFELDKEFNLNLIFKLPNLNNPSPVISDNKLFIFCVKIVQDKLWTIFNYDFSYNTFNYLFSSKTIVASPAICKYGNNYYMFVESKTTITDKWSIDLYRSDQINGDYKALNRIFDNNSACPCVNNDTLFYSKQENNIWNMKSCKINSILDIYEHI
jgi:hypothetical protein